MAPKPSLSRHLAEFAAGTRERDVPAAARRIAITGIVDAVATMIAGLREPAPAVLQGVIASGSSEAHVAFSGRQASAPDAAWIGGTAAHALDYDDVAIHGHPSAVLVPALLAEAEGLDASGRDFLTAYAVGFEVWADLVLREPDLHHRKGWHPTGLFGAVGAAAACCKLGGLSPAQTLNALGLAASSSGGLMANFGSMAKPLHAGAAARNGLVAARLARAGMTASPDAIDHPLGLLYAVSPNGRVDRERPAQVGVRWRLPELGLSIKKYPVCLSAHRAVDGLRALVAEHGIRPGDVRGVRIAMSARNAMILRHHRPASPTEARFSAEFAAAAALIAGRLTMAELSPEFVGRRDVQALMARVEIKPDQPEDAATGYAACDEIAIDIGDAVYTKRIGAIRGSAALPLSEEELFAKFADCLASGGSPLEPRRFFDRLCALETIADMRAFVADVVAENTRMREAATPSAARLARAGAWPS